MQSIETEQPPNQDQPSPSDVQAIRQLFKRIAERGRRIRKEREAAERQTADEKAGKEQLNEH